MASAAGGVLSSSWGGRRPPERSSWALRCHSMPATTRASSGASVSLFFLRRGPGVDWASSSSSSLPEEPRGQLFPPSPPAEGLNSSSLLLETSGGAQPPQAGQEGGDDDDEAEAAAAEAELCQECEVSHS